MNLFHLQRRGDVEYDEVAGFVIRAKNAKEARQLAALQARDEGKEVWLDKAKTKCTRITPWGKSRIIMRDFRAG